MAIPVALALAGCGGNYPSEASIDFGEPLPNGVSISGTVLEMNSGLKDQLPSINNMRQEVTAFLESPKDNQLSFWRDLSRERRDRIDALREEHAAAQSARMAQYTEWREKTSNALAELNAEKAETETQWERYQSFIGEAEAQLAAVNEKMQAAEARQAAITQEVRDYTNRRIVEEQLAVRQLGPRGNVLGWSSNRWRDGVDVSTLTCAPRDNRVTLDLTAEDRSCVYIEYPIAQLANDEYDELLRQSTLEYLRLNRDIGQNSGWNRPATGLRGELQQAREAVQNAQILAENQTGTTARNLENRRNQLNTRIEQTERQLEQAARQLDEGEFASFLPVDRNLGRQTGMELRNLLNDHIHEHIDSQIERSILNRVSVDAEGNISGLSRKGDYLVVLLNITERNRFGQQNSHAAFMLDVNSGDLDIRDKTLMISDDNPFQGHGNFDRDDRFQDLVFSLFNRL
ncbi:MAG: hypothetical protein EA348_00345 [Pseudomonadaceae bacterium]|nr:MAG: hypothetical protein EA348_00345 [Pseudomonadaceae bacterium]